MRGFHPLPVTDVDRLTDDAVAVTFRVPEQLRTTFDFRAGQHVTVRRTDQETGEDVRRSYSICSTPQELRVHGRLRIGVKQITGGVFSGYAATLLRSGDTLDVLPPLGHFTIGGTSTIRGTSTIGGTSVVGGRSAAGGSGPRYGMIAAGSGITPVLSLAATVLAEGASVMLLYANRTSRSVMFAEELADLKDRYLGRLQILHVLSREPGESELLSGRLDADRLAGLLDLVGPADEWFLCGPYALVIDARQALVSRGVDQSCVHTELFHVDEGPQPALRHPGSADAGPGVEVTVTLDGRASSFTMGRDERVLDAAIRVRPELPFACKGGVCATCRARVVDGKVEMARNYALEPDELARGYVLTCQASPLSDRLVVDYDG